MRTAMKIMRSLLPLALVALSMVPAAAQTVLDRAVISAGGGTSTTASSRLDYTIAEPAIGIATNGQTVGQFGFWTADGAVTLSAPSTGAGAITAMRLSPNPATESSRLLLSLAAAARVDVTLHDATGRQIARRELGRLGAGEHTITVDLAGLPSGGYSLVASVDGALMRVPVSIVR
jgi:hypothetical protein